MAKPYGEDGEVFGFSLFLVLSNRLTTCAVSLISLLVLAPLHPCLPLARLVTINEHLRLAAQFQLGIHDRADSLITAQWTRQGWMPAVPLYKYAAVSLSNVVATTCQYEALKYVTFPLQTLGKCAKMLPVMLWGGLIMGKRHAALPMPT